MSPLRIALGVACALGLAASVLIAIREHGWRRGLLVIADVLLWSAIPIAHNLLVQALAGTIAALCVFPLYFAAGWYGRTSIGIANFLVLQWLGVRLARVWEADLNLGCPGADGSIGTWRRPVGWSLLRWVWPLTGWWSELRWIARRP